MIPDILERLSGLIELDYVYDMVAYDVLWWLMACHIHRIEKRSKVFSYWRGSHVVSISVNGSEYEIIYTRRKTTWTTS